MEIEGEEAAEAGFTLIELMVVLLIIAILLAIAIPTFLGVTNTAGDRAAQSNLTNALTEGKALYEVNDAYHGERAAYTSGTFRPRRLSSTGPTARLRQYLRGELRQLCRVQHQRANDSQGLSLAVDSSKTNTCWYAFDLEATPPATGGLRTDSFPTAASGTRSRRLPAQAAWRSTRTPTTQIRLTGFAAGGAGSSYSQRSRHR